MKLKLERKVFYEVDYGDLEEFVKKIYPDNFGDYCFVLTEECGNNSHHTFNVDGKLGEMWEKWDKADFEKGEAHNDTILNKLCADGHIPKGKYIINVYW